jgi:hypothetical protein
MFHGNDPDGSGYKTRAHLAEVIAMLGPPPLDFLRRGSRSKEFFDDDGKYIRPSSGPLHCTNLSLGKWKVDIPLPQGISLESSEDNLEGKGKEQFMAFMRGMLQWRPEDRKTAKQLLDDPWLKNTLG